MIAEAHRTTRRLTGDEQATVASPSFPHLPRVCSVSFLFCCYFHRRVKAPEPKGEGFGKPERRNYKYAWRRGSPPKQSEKQTLFHDTRPAFLLIPLPRFLVRRICSVYGIRPVLGFLELRQMFLMVGANPRLGRDRRDFTVTHLPSPAIVTLPLTCLRRWRVLFAGLFHLINLGLFVGLHYFANCDTRRIGARVG